MDQLNGGFTLIEFMIALALVSILASIAIPSYFDYVARTQVTQLVGELSNYRSAYESALAEGGPLTNDSLGYVPSSLESVNPAGAVATTFPDGSARLQIEMGGETRVGLAGLVIRLERTPGGVWSCVIQSAAAPGWDESYALPHCSVT